MRIIRDLEAARSMLLQRSSQEWESEAQETVRQIIDDVRAGGDSALFRHSKAFDSVEPSRPEASPPDIAASRERAGGGRNPRKVESAGRRVGDDPRGAGGLVSHGASAINGGAIARGTSFLKDRMGERVFAPGVPVAATRMGPRRRGIRPAANPPKAWSCPGSRYWQSSIA